MKGFPSLKSITAKKVNSGSYLGLLTILHRYFEANPYLYAVIPLHAKIASSEMCASSCQPLRQAVCGDVRYLVFLSHDSR
jgi:hypothetical protein